MGELLANIEENIGGLRIIKAFDSEIKSQKQFEQTAVDIAAS